MKKFFKNCWILFATLTILLAVSTGFFRSLSPFVVHYKKNIEHHLSVITGQTIRIKTLETGWYWFQPVLQLKNVTVENCDNKSLHLERLLVGLDIFQTIIHWKIVPGIVYIDQLHLKIRENNEKWLIEGINPDPFAKEELELTQYQQLFLWLSQQKKLVIKKFSIYFYFKNGAIIPLDGLNLSISNDKGYYKIKGNAQLKQTQGTSFKILANGFFDPSEQSKNFGSFYCSAQDLNLAQWQSVFQKNNVHINGGKGNIKLWIDLQKGTVSDIQAQVKVKRLAWSLLPNEHSQLMQNFSANIAWKPSSTGWDLQSDSINLRLGGIDWPENKIVIKHNSINKTYRYYIKYILLDSLFSTAVNWPVSLEGILKTRASGILTDTRFSVAPKTNYFNLPAVPLLNSHASNEIQLPAKSLIDDENLSWAQKHKITSFSTRFKQLSWLKSKILKLPTVANLAGILQWNPTHGRLILDSQDLNVMLSNQAVEKVNTLFASCDWRQSKYGLDFNIDYLKINHKNLDLKLEGSIKNWNPDFGGELKVNADFAANHLEYWKFLLPQKSLKPKLYEWLNHELRTVDTLQGRLRLFGNSKKFPFDNNDGLFVISSKFRGAIIKPNRGWKTIKEINGDLSLINRDLRINASHANAAGALIQQLNLQIADIGSGKEVLQVQSKSKAQLENIKNYVLSSPLHTKLLPLKTVKAKGLAELNFKVNLPLYPNSLIKMQGNIAFDNNDILINQYSKNINIKQLSGVFSFSEQGIEEGLLKANGFGNPLLVAIKKEHFPNMHTYFYFKGKISSHELIKPYQNSFVHRFAGNIPFTAKLSLNNKSAGIDIDLHSDLSDLSINLPLPFGKKKHEPNFFDLKICYQKPNHVYFKTNYANQFQTDLKFNLLKNHFEIEQGNIYLGERIKNALPDQNLNFIAHIKEFNWEQWRPIFLELQSKDSDSKLNDIPKNVIVSVPSMKIYQQQFDNFYAQASIDQDQWKIFVNSQQLRGKLNFNTSKKVLKGAFSRLEINVSKNHDPKNKITHIEKPEDLPSIKLNIKELTVNKLKFENFYIETVAEQNQWQIKNLQFEDVEQKLQAQGIWKSYPTAFSQFHAVFTSRNLKHTLQRLGIKPVINAKNTYIELKSHWSKPLDEISFADMYGNLSLQLKNGRVTHLDQVTEEKLDFGKLFSILSLQTLPRRLQLDFSDLANQGYSFDTFQGNFKIQKGIMRTKDSFLDGPVALTKIQGILDLGQKIYDLKLKIIPHLTSSLPLVATIAGGPIAGVATWVATKLINESMQKIVAYNYTISGPWQHPVIEQISSIRKEKFLELGKGPIQNDLLNE